MRNIFKDGTGVFDRQRLEFYLRSIGMGEEAYLDTVRHDIVRSRIVESLATDLKASSTVAARIQAFRDEQRKGRALFVKADEMKGAPPADDVLQTYLTDNAKTYEAPEFRAVTLVIAGPDDIADGIDIPEADIKQAYDERAAEFRTPERRGIDQLLAPSQEVAQEAVTRANSGESFEAIAAALKDKKVERTQLDALGHGDLPEALDKVVFSLAEGAVGGPVETPFGWHVIKVTSLQPETVRPLDAVKDDIRRDLAHQRAIDQLPNLSTQLDDEIAAGTDLAAAAQKLGLQPLVLKQVDARGHDAKKEALAPDKLTPEILTAIFAGKVGETSLLSETTDGRYYMFRVDGIEPARARTVDEARDELVEAWTKQEQQKQAKAKAEELRQRITSPADLATVAAGLPEVEVREVGPIKRGEQGFLQLLNPAAVAAMFATEAGSVAPGVLAVPEGSAILAVDAVIPAQVKETDGADIAKAMTDGMRSDVLAQYEAGLRERYTVEINNNVLGQLMEQEAQ